MALCGVGPGPALKRILTFLREIYFNEGHIGEEAGAARVTQWWNDHHGPALRDAVRDLPDRQAGLALEYLLSLAESDEAFDPAQAPTLVAKWLSAPRTERKKPAP